MCLSFFSMDNSHIDHCHEEEPYFTSNVLLVLVVLSLITGLLTGGGNSLVVLSVYIFRNLRKYSNYFLVSLAVADLSVGLVAIPLYCIGAITWPHTLGTIVGHGLDFFMMLSLTASSLNLVAVSYDRHLAVSSPLRYSSLMGLRRCRMIIALVWVFSFFIASFSFSANDLRSRSILNVTFIIISFVFPLMVLTTVQFNIFKAVRRQLLLVKDTAVYVKNEDIPRAEEAQAEEKHIIQHQGIRNLETESVVDSCQQHDKTPPELVTDSVRKRNQDDPSKTGIFRSPRHFQLFRYEENNFMRTPTGRLRQGFISQKNSSTHLYSPRHHYPHSYHSNHSHNKHEHHFSTEFPLHRFVFLKQLLKHHKYAITLCLIIGCFTLCWLPTFVLIIIQAVDSDLCSIIKHEQLYFVTLLVALANSLLNPFIYSARLSGFRKAFVKLLKCKCQSSV